MEIFNEDKISFWKHQENKDFDYVFCLTNEPQKNNLKRNREENLGPAAFLSSSQTTKTIKYAMILRKN